MTRINESTNTTFYSIFPLFLKLGAEILHRIDHNDTIGIDVLHNVIHLLLGYRDAAARARLSVAEAMQEDRGAFARRSFLVIADIHTVLVLVLIINDVLAVLGLKIRIILDAYHLIVFGITVTRPISIIIDLGVLNGTAGIVGNAESGVEAEAAY